MVHKHINSLKTDVQTHGEVHATVEEHDQEVEIRLGTVEEWDDGNGMLILSNGQTTLRIGHDRIVDWYLPVAFYHE